MPRNVGPFSYDILACLRDNPSNSYGLSIRKQLEERSGRKVNIGAIYVTLERLERQGYIASCWGEATAERGGRRKRLYTLNAAGEQALTRFEASHPAQERKAIGGWAWIGWMK